MSKNGTFWLQLGMMAGLLIVLGACQGSDSNGEGGGDAIATDAANQSCPSLVGSWELVSIDEGASALGGSFESDPNYQVAPTLKVINDTHWMFIRQSSGQFIFSQGGRYKLENGKYTETVGYSAIPQNVGISFEFECRIEGDSLWHHVGGIGDSRYDEVWRRVK